MSNKPVKPNITIQMNEVRSVNSRLLDIESLFVELVKELKAAGVVSSDFPTPKVDYHDH
jgi:hypothetical protein